MPDLWPFPVRHPVTEVLEWNTDTLITEAAEERIALRTLPRSILTVSHFLNASDLSRAAELARAGLVNKWTVPLWHLARPSTVHPRQPSQHRDRPSSQPTEGRNSSSRSARSCQTGWSWPRLRA